MLSEKIIQFIAVNFKKAKEAVLNNKKLALTSVVIVANLLLIGAFPSENEFQMIVIGLTFLFVIPLLYIKIVLGDSLGDFGIKSGDWKIGLALSALFLVIILPSMYFVYKYTEFLSYYQLPDGSTASFGFFVLYELFFVGLFLALLEFFFHGFIMFSFFGKNIWTAVLLQFFIFIVFLALNDILDWRMFPYIVTSLFGGIIAIKSKSLWYSYIFGLIFIILHDAIFIKIIN